MGTGDWEAVLVRLRSTSIIPAGTATDSTDCRYEYLALFASLILVLLETVIHLITFCLREWTAVIDTVQNRPADPSSNTNHPDLL